MPCLFQDLIEHDSGMLQATMGVTAITQLLVVDV